MGITAIGGLGFGDVPDDSDAVNLLDRGIYFDGNDYLTILNYMQHVYFTIQIWVRAEGGESTLYSIAKANVETEEDLLTFKLGPNLSFCLIMRMHTGEYISGDSPDDSYSTKQWSQLAASATWVAGIQAYTLVFMSNGANVGSASYTTTTHFIDDNINHHIIGAQADIVNGNVLTYNSYYVGMMYEFKILPRAKVTMEEEDTTNPN